LRKEDEIMPFLAMDTWVGVSDEIKKRWIFEATRVTTELLNVPPDKIQVLIRENEKGNFGKAGAVPTDPDFASKSRLINWTTQESYAGDTTPNGNMVVIAIDTWNMYNQKQKNEWTRHITKLTEELLSTPADQILILIRDMPPGNWGQTGVTGAQADFLAETRRMSSKLSSI
jgi:4-oxalocrotonate tautomerase